MLSTFYEAILEADTNATRFEQFCLAIFESHEKRKLVPTSVTYDLGRDARTATGGSGTQVFLCATLNRELDGKIKSDLERISTTAIPQRVIYCTSQPLTELKLSQLEATIRDMLPPMTSVSLFGSKQLAHLIAKQEETFEKHYAAEVSNIKSRLLAGDEGEDSGKIDGLRLALMAFGSEESVELRSKISCRAVLDVLRYLGAGSIGEIAEKLSADLGLPISFNSEYINSILSKMQEQKLVENDAERWRLTELGVKEAEEVPVGAAHELLEGRRVVREKLEELVGVAIAEQQYEQIWSTLLDFLSNLFYSNGLQIIRAVNSILNAEGASGQSGADMEKLITEGANKIRALVTNEKLALELEQAVVDMFLERSGPAFDWLAKVSERFVALCALGLEASSSSEIKNVVKRICLVLDSDIVLTLLCAGEKDHQAANRLLNRFGASGGKAFVSSYVLEEVAIHAWISERDFLETNHLLGKLDQLELRRHIDNAFVRTFHFHAKKKEDAKLWRKFIGQYRGGKEEDYSKILRELRDEFGVRTMSDQYDSALQKSISDFICNSIAERRGTSCEQLERKDLAKAHRDGGYWHL